MPRPSQAEDRRKEFVPIIAQTFANLGYQRTTTAELARRCGVRENILYRLWRDKKAMFIASIEFVYERSAQTWARLLAAGGDARTSIERVLQYEAAHHGESKLHRLVFAGLNETDDPKVRKALGIMYQRFHRFVAEQIGAYRSASQGPPIADPDMSAWAIIGLGTVASIVQELGLLKAGARRRFMLEMGRMMLEEKISQ